MGFIDVASAQGRIAAFNGVIGSKLRANDSITFSVAEISQVFKQTGCTSLRIYFATDSQDPNELPTVILVGVDANGKNISGANAKLVEYGMHDTKAL